MRKTAYEVVREWSGSTNRYRHDSDKAVRIIIRTSSNNRTGGRDCVTVSLLNKKEKSCLLWAKFSLSELCYLIERYKLNKATSLIEESDNQHECNASPSPENASQLSALAPTDSGVRIASDV